PYHQQFYMALGLEQGIYHVTVTDALGCSAIQEAVVIAPEQITITVSPTEASCEIADGTATVMVSGGTTPYTYHWSNGDTTALADTLEAGIHVVTVTDYNECTNFAIVPVNNANAPVITLTGITQSNCYGDENGEIDIAVTGGTSPYQYEWSNGATSVDITNLSAGAYEIEILDAAGCKSFQSYIVEQPEPFEIFYTTIPATCGGNDGTASVSVTGGTAPYSYVWTTGGTNSSISNVSAGNYTVTITDAHSCTTAITIPVSEAGAPEITIDTVMNIACGQAGGSIYITVSGGVSPYNYQWSNDSLYEDLIDMPVNEYFVTVTDAAGCKSIAGAEITNIPPLSPSICIVLVDTITGTNLIAWEKEVTEGIVSYNLYRESSQMGVYTLIANVPFEDMSEFTDIIANPMVRSWRYGLTAIDDCGNESPMSPVHQTIHLSASMGLSDNVNLIWNHYDGFTYPTYYINRYSVTNGWELVNSLPANLNTYTDFVIPNKTRFYYISVDKAEECIPTSEEKAQGGPYSQSFSNLDDPKANTGIYELQQTMFDLLIYPNPFNNYTNIQYSLNEPSKIKLEIYNMLGKKVAELANNEQQRGIYRYRFDTEEKGHAPGIYLLKFYINDYLITKRIVKI
ncbi:MAG: T9SS type A sorting domain-containing protein, partial [Bacteroidia bacterium]|nr:T9SS type A sorting domain-containing protein [Bacteroidia bacterium]